VTDDVRISVALRHHRKTKRLRRKLGASACWSLVCLFLFAGEQRWTGDLSGMTSDDIEDEADWDGDRGEFVAALVALGFLDGIEGAYRIHDWEKHNPYAASKGQRIEKGKKAAEARWNGVKKNAQSMPRASNEHSPGTESDAASTPKQCPPAPTPAPTPPEPRNQALTSNPPQASEQIDGLVGTFEGHEHPRAAPNPAAPFAVALRRAGLMVTGMDPELIGYVTDGGTVEHLLEVAEIHGKRGKGYVLKVARQEILTRPADVVVVDPAPINAVPRRMGQTATALALLQDDKTWTG
jgi:hypothetical protein